ncbi:lysozyme inhibitor LprI family protein [Burkholderia contaminans]|uniref:lysozyme inhibitor LprI family protein n=1 Tax=Burkholderia contaminans TaxID=488447 RepID=UPI0021AB45EC|nr:lysozyme inhibitor LprI family protein [Burkholderia contaminans]
MRRSRPCCGCDAALASDEGGARRICRAGHGVAGGTVVAFGAPCTVFSGGRSFNIEPPGSRDRRFVQEAMKKTICLALLLLPLSARAETCAGDGNVHDDLSCVDRALTQSKKDLNLIYRKIYAATQYKNEFEQSQKAWLDYRDRQCNGYIAAEASQSQGEGSGLITRDCLLTITRQRVDYLKTLVGK